LRQRFASKNQNDENGVIEHLQNEYDEQSRSQEAVATEVSTPSEQIRPDGRKKRKMQEKGKHIRVKVAVHWATPLPLLLLLL
jgi:hypothetical protein